LILGKKKKEFNPDAPKLDRIPFPDLYVVILQSKILYIAIRENAFMFPVCLQKRPRKSVESHNAERNS
jgi:hypothetical protein